MATIVQHRITLSRYAFLSASYSTWKSARANRFWGDIAPVVEEGTVKTVAVCDSSGEVQYFPAELIKVISVDGVDVGEILAAVDGSSTPAVHDS